jgi:hypothetical protein
MQTRKNRKNDETSYEKMLKLRFVEDVEIEKMFLNAFYFRRDLSRAVKLLEMVKRREKTKRDELQLSIEIYEKRYQAKDFSGQLLAEYTSSATKLRYTRTGIAMNQNLTQFHRFQTCFCTVVFKSVSSPTFVQLRISSAQSMELVPKLFKSSSSPAEQQKRF